MKFIGMLEDEVFVGNINADCDLSDLVGINYRVGELALDIHGNKIDPNYMLPLFIKKNSFELYDNYKMNEMKRG